MAEEESSSDKRKITERLVLHACSNLPLVPTGSVFLFASIAYSTWATADLYGSELPARISQSGLNFSYKDLKKATCSFDLAYKIGQGSNGTVYKVHIHGSRTLLLLFLHFCCTFLQYNCCKNVASCTTANGLSLRGCNYLAYRLFFLVGMKSLQRDCSWTQSSVSISSSMKLMW